ncbi:glycosyltransferase family 29 protein [uncultured Thiothrix sp.]|uniref:glycosyltransferase family 29 protein n=1 Tax=uncultured Thiothrix sp. TaxID=223185 RepID=UPI002633C780|nr:glycosyltransferase family 29 protein [uncultured Thiothrix sp.]
MILNKLRAFIFYKQARKFRRQGQYSSIALKLFLRAWLLSKNKNYLLGYIKYRRDLGRVISFSLARKIIQAWPGFNQKERELLFAFLLEGGFQGLTPPDSVFITKSSIPAVLASKDFEHISRQQQFLVSIYSQQSLWRTELTKLLQYHVQRQGICIVGNSGNMLNTNLGSTIDAAGFIVRFNAFQSGKHFTTDLGQQCNLWCMTPSFKPNKLRTVDWLLVTGPEIQYRLADWGAFYPFLEKQIPIVTVPLEVWRQLVTELQAPPSAGISVLAFFYWLLGSWAGISVAGFGALSETQTTYHYMNPKNKPSERHNWVGEERIIRRWLKEGLRSLHS